MRLFRAGLIAGVLTLLMASQTGCLLVAAAAATGGTVAYVKGKSVNTVDGNPKQVAQATEKAFKEMDMVIISNQSSTADAEIVARTARDVKIDVVAKSESDKLSTVFVRVGTFGDEALQNRVLDKIKANLAAATTQPSPSSATASAK
jgi:hypothetical protein